MTTLYQGEQDADTPLARWRFTEGSGSTFADDVGGATATISGAVTPGVVYPGPYPAAGAGGDFAGGSASLTGASAWRPQTVEALILLDTVPATSSTLRPTIFSHDGTGAPPLPLVLAWDVDGAHQGVLGVGFFKAGYQSVSMTGALSTGVLHHIVGVYDGSTTLTLWVDGVSVASGTVTARGSMTGVAGTAWIGRRYDGSAFIDGRVYDLALYNAGLSSGRVAAHYAAVQQLAGLAVTGGGALAFSGAPRVQGSWVAPISGGGVMKFRSSTRGVGAPSRVRFTPHPSDYAQG